MPLKRTASKFTGNANSPPKKWEGFVENCGGWGLNSRNLKAEGLK